MKKISIIIPALNEEENLEKAVRDLCSALKSEISGDGWEVLIFDDGSTDKTGEIADNLAVSNAHIKVVHNGKNMGLGYNFRKGVELARGEYVTWFPGDGENEVGSTIVTLKHIGDADIIIPYTSNMEVRTFKRRIVSRIYTGLVNFFFGLNLRYYNGLSVYKKDLLMKVPAWGNSFAFAVEILVPLLKSGVSFIEVPIKIKLTIKTSALKLKNIFKVGLALSSLFWRIIIKKERIKI